MYFALSIIVNLLNASHYLLFLIRLGIIAKIS